MADRERAGRAIEEFLKALGYGPRPDLAGTGRRVADAWIDELLAGEGADAAEILRQGSIPLGPGDHGAVVVRGIEVATMCPHHLLPAHGTAVVGYQPHGALAGLGVVARAVDVLARRLTLQETLGREIAEAIDSGLQAKGAFCHLSLVHTCLSVRGERQSRARVETLALSGCFATDAREMAMSLIAGRGSMP
jgi:GTP cyclohydrolase I